MRNANVPVEPQMFLTTNPDFHSFLRLWIQDFYLDQEGIPREDRTNVERYFVVVDGQPRWFDTREEAEAIYGKGDANGVRSFRAIKANIRDNLPLLKNNPSYISNLMSLSPIKRAIMLEGSWLAREEESGYFKRDWVTMVLYPNFNATKRVRSWDLAATLPTKSGSADGSNSSTDPDWTAGVLGSREKTGVITIEDVVRIRNRPHVVRELIFDTAKRDGKDVVITIPLDPGATAGAYCRQLQKDLIEMGYVCKLVRPDKSKLQRFRPFAAISEARFVQVVEADWNNDFFVELENFTGDGKRKDDQVDCVSDMYYTLTKESILPEFSLPDFTSTPAFSFN
jgi:predicted phage terminase large subunit-like protein